MKRILSFGFVLSALSFVTPHTARAQPTTPVAPGTVVVHLNGRLMFSFSASGSNANDVTTSTGTYKLNTVNDTGDLRIYPGFDARTMNGIEYGAAAEIRTAKSDAGQGTSSVTNGAAGYEGLYVFSGYGYIGTRQAGYVRFGQVQGAFMNLQVGVIENFGDGAQWHSDGGVSSQLPTAATPGLFYTAGQGTLVETNKLVYISPVYDGASMSVSYEANSNGLKEGAASCTTAASDTCASLGSSPVLIPSRRKNTVDGMVEYTTNPMKDMKIAVSGGYLHGAPVNYTGVPTPGQTTPHYGYDDLSVYQAGAQMVWGGLTVGANIKGGQVEDSWVLKPKGARNGLTYIVGATYTQGQWLVGGNFFNGQTAGNYSPGAPSAKTEARTLSEYGVATAVDYILTKNALFYVQYMYGHRHQPGNTAISASGNGQVQAIAAGATLVW